MEDCFPVKARPSGFADLIDTPSVLAAKALTPHLNEVKSKSIILYGMMSSGRRTLAQCLAQTLTSEQPEYTPRTFNVQNKEVLVPMFSTRRTIELSIKDIENRTRLLMNIVALTEETSNWDYPVYLIAHESQRITSWEYVNYVLSHYPHIRFIFITTDILTFPPDIVSRCHLICCQETKMFLDRVIPAAFARLGLPLVKIPIQQHQSADDVFWALDDALCGRAMVKSRSITDDIIAETRRPTPSVEKLKELLMDALSKDISLETLAFRLCEDAYNKFDIGANPKRREAFFQKICQYDMGIRHGTRAIIQVMALVEYLLSLRTSER
jgi:hypothetical protein